MRISPVLFLLPVLVLTGSAAIATDDRPASPQPAIASPVPAPVTIESLAGTYKGVINEQALTAILGEAKKRGSDEVSLKKSELFIRQTSDQMRITINADSTFELQSEFKSESGNVKINGNQLIFTINKIDGKPIRFTEEPLTLEVSADRKTLLYKKSKSTKILSGYRRQ